jgi:hypothetical protein
MPYLKLHDPKVLEMLSKKVMCAVRREHTTPFHKHLPICNPALGKEFLQQILLHYDLNPKL